jgi:hypothetical protein
MLCVNTSRVKRRVVKKTTCSLNRVFRLNSVNHYLSNEQLPAVSL